MHALLLITCAGMFWAWLVSMEVQPEAADHVPVAATPRSWRWIYATVMLCLYGFFKEFKPSEPFLTPYLESSAKNFTRDEVNGEIYPYWPYAYLVAAFFTFLLTDIVRYKPVILLESGAYLATRFLLIWGTTVFSMQWMQVVYGVATATEIAYFSYIYAAVSKIHFKKVTSYVRAVRLTGQSMAGILGQIIVSTNKHHSDAEIYLWLNYIAFASVTLACVIAILLPNVCGCSLLCKSPREEEQSLIDPNENTCVAWLKRTTIKRWTDFKRFYSVPSLLKWSIWWALATCGVLQVGNYVQSLWKDVGKATGESYEYNGLVEAMATLTSAGAAFVISFMKVNWPVWGELTIGLLSLVDGVVLLAASSANYLWGVYLCHIVYRSTYTFLITIASAQIALNVTHESYALIFGFNSFLALILQTILTLVVSDEHGLNLPIKQQFVVYSCYYFFLTLIFLGAGVFKLTSTGWARSFRVCCQETIPVLEVEQPDEQTFLVYPEANRHTLLFDSDASGPGGAVVNQDTVNSELQNCAQKRYRST